MDRCKLGDKIDRLIKENGLSQADLAEILGVKRSSVNTWIKGRHAPSSRKLTQISKLFGIGLRWFRDEKASYPPDPSFRIEKSEQNGKNQAEEQAIPSVEAISDILYKINHPDLQELLKEINDHSNNGKAGDLESVLKMFIEKMEGKKRRKVVKLHYIRRKGNPS